MNERKEKREIKNFYYLNLHIVKYLFSGFSPDSS